MITGIYLDQIIDPNAIYLESWTVASDIYAIATACNFKVFIQNMFSVQLQNLPNNIYGSMPRMMKYVFILMYGIIFSNKWDVGEAVGTFISGTFEVYRPTP